MTAYRKNTALFATAPSAPPPAAPAGGRAAPRVSRVRLARDGSTSRGAPDQGLGQHLVAPARAGHAPQVGVREEWPGSPQSPSNALADVEVHAPAGRDLPLAALWG